MRRIAWQIWLSSVLCVLCMAQLSCDDSGLTKGQSPEIIVDPSVAIFSMPDGSEVNLKTIEVSNVGGVALLIASVTLSEEDAVEEISILDAQDWTRGGEEILPQDRKQLTLQWTVLDAIPDVATLTFNTNAGVATVRVETPDLDPEMQVKLTPGGIQPDDGGSLNIDGVMPGSTQSIQVQMQSMGFVPLTLSRFCFVGAEETCLDGQEEGGGVFRLCNGPVAQRDCDPPILPETPLIMDETYTFSVLYRPLEGLIDTAGARLLLINDSGQTPRYLIDLIGRPCIRGDDQSNCGSCGDGVVDEGEECDDANLNNTDRCLNTCRLSEPRCGDGIVQIGVEECDDGNRDNTDECRNDCRAAPCGDGPNQTGAEDCDDNNPCTLDSCEIDTGFCAHELLEGDSCTATSGCTDVGSCVEGVCTPTEGDHCDDDNMCTNERCDGETNTCVYDISAEQDGMPCGDLSNDLCTQNLCVEGMCTAEAIDCSDGDPCTVDQCDDEVWLLFCSYTRTRGLRT